MTRRPHCRLLVASAKQIRFLERRNEPPTVWLFFLAFLRLKPDVVKNVCVCVCVLGGGGGGGGGGCNNERPQEPSERDLYNFYKWTYQAANGWRLSQFSI